MISTLQIISKSALISCFLRRNSLSQGTSPPQGGTKKSTPLRGAKKLLRPLLAALLILFWETASFAVQNPDQISVFFPAFEGPENLGLNVSTVLSLQLAQTTRRNPWPENPEEHDFGEGVIRWSAAPLEHYSASEMIKVGQNLNLLAQIVVAGKARRYGKDVVVELDIVLPRYRRAPSLGCSNSGKIKCDFRQKNFERWSINVGDNVVEVGVPRRAFHLSAIVLTPEVIEQYSTSSGLTIRDSIDGGAVLGKTGNTLRFIEFNKHMAGAPTKVRSGGVTGYVSLPELSEEVSEFADMVGGILQVFRGDWELAIKSFTNVLENKKTRIPTKVDALLYRGMAKYRNGADGYSDITAAAELAPYDAMVVRYLVMAHLAGDTEKSSIAEILKQQSYLFNANDRWFNRVRALVMTE